MDMKVVLLVMIEKLLWFIVFIVVIKIIVNLNLFFWMKFNRFLLYLLRLMDMNSKVDVEKGNYFIL